MKINYFMHVLGGRIYNCAVPPSDTPVRVAGEAEPVLVGTAVTQAVLARVCRPSPRENVRRHEEYRRACVAHIPAAFANDWVGAKDGGG